MRRFIKSLFVAMVLAAVLIATLEAWLRYAKPQADFSHKQATLLITSFPTGADITVDGIKYKDQTPVRVYNLDPKEITVTLSRTGYREATQKIKLNDADDNRIELTLAAIDNVKIDSGFDAYVNTKTLSILAEPKTGATVGQTVPYKTKIRVTGVTADGNWYKVAFANSEGYIGTDAPISRTIIAAHSRYRPDESIANIKVNVFSYAPEEKQAEVMDFKNVTEPSLKAAMNFHNSVMLGESKLQYEFKDPLAGGTYQNLLTNGGTSRPASYTYTDTLFKTLIGRDEITSSTADTLVLNLVVVPRYESDRSVEVYESSVNDTKKILLISMGKLLTASDAGRENWLYSLIARGFGVYNPFGTGGIDIAQFETPLSQRSIPNEILADLGINKQALK